MLDKIYSLWYSINEKRKRLSNINRIQTQFECGKRFCIESENGVLIIKNISDLILAFCVFIFSSCGSSEPASAGSDDTTAEGQI